MIEKDPRMGQIRVLMPVLHQAITTIGSVSSVTSPFAEEGLFCRLSAVPAFIAAAFGGFHSTYFTFISGSPLTLPNGKERRISSIGVPYRCSVILKELSVVSAPSLRCFDANLKVENKLHGSFSITNN